MSLTYGTDCLTRMAVTGLSASQYSAIGNLFAVIIGLVKISKEKHYGQSVSPHKVGKVFLFGLSSAKISAEPHNLDSGNLRSVRRHRLATSLRHHALRRTQTVKR